jgi:hypothetical protein
MKQTIANQIQNENSVWWDNINTKTLKKTDEYNSLQFISGNRTIGWDVHLEQLASFG